MDKGQLKYSFLESDIPFDIRDQTGDIFVKSKLDFDEGEKVSSFFFCFQ